ncbi:MAG TPA: NAD(P)/FAD-dependent oxidoreductase [Terriglobia bacterium]|nr:NAD(P)/FAD-dependent oxidoreductase [Terriglobia bacterium]
MLHRADILIAGAGPAGSTAAKLLADRGYHVVLIDRAIFPRHKTCASWINRLAIERFPYLKPHLEELVESPFCGVTFYDSSLDRSATFAEGRPSGYLSLRAKFDDGLRRIAVEAGAEFYEGRNVASVEQDGHEVQVRTTQGCIFRGRVLIGADGASSRVAMSAGLHRGWKHDDYVMCANADVPYDPEKIARFFGSRIPLQVYLQYRRLLGYGWIFPKKRHICVGLGAMLADNRRIRPLFNNFFGEARQHGLLPRDLELQGTRFDVDPVGAVHRLPSLTRGRVMLIGDAAGFVSGSTGEGIYPGMVSAEVASAVIHRALSKGAVEEQLAEFNNAWRPPLESYVRRLPGGEKETHTSQRINLIFRSALLARVAGRIFLYGEQPSLKTFARCLWPASG